MADNNPYIGPASFGEKDRGRFFGRDDEARELSYLLIARPVVLLYAQSGAGKTSLLQAKVVPDLRESGEMRVLPIARVSGPAEGDNVYAANALTGLKLSVTTLTGALAPFFTEAQDGEKQLPLLLIFDQFEEIFTFHPELASQRREFFEQLRDCLAAYPKLGLLLSMREDYLADMDSFAGYLPDRLRTRMRMERLSDKQAEEAIARPAADAGKPFDAGIARKLADDLRRVQISHQPSADATDNGHALGKYVEPVQLQIVCRQLWSQLPADATTITAQHIETLARVDDALTNFYRDSLAAVREKLPTLSERALRRWFGERLITSAKTRGMVYQGESETEKLPNAAVEVLREKYILRADNRPSGTWYELAHDRLVEPIVADNLEWRTSYKNPAAAALELGSDHLLTGSGLVDALRYELEHPEELTPEERLFLKKSETEEKKAKVRRGVAIGITAVVILTLSILTGWALNQKKLAERQAMLAESSTLAAQAGTLLARGERGESLDRAIHAFGVAATEEAREAVFRAFPQLAAKLEGHADAVNSAAFSPDGQRIITTSADGTARVWNAASGQQVAQLGGHAAVNSAAFSPDGQRILTAGRDNIARVWNAAGGQQMATLKGHIDQVNSAAFSPDGQRIVTTSDDKTARIWNAASGKEMRKLEGRFRNDSAAFSPDGQRILTAGFDNTARVWNAASGQQVATLKGHKELVTSAAFSPDGQRVVTASVDKTARIWNAASGQQVAKLDGHTDQVTSVAFSPDGQRVVTASADGTARIWNAASGQQVAKLDGHTDQVTSVAFSPDGQRIVTASADKTARIWNAASGQPVETLEGHTDEVNSAAFSPDGQRVVTASVDKTARIWNAAASGRQVAKLDGHTDQVPSTAFSPDGQRIVTTSDDGTARIWNAASGQQVAKLDGHTEEVRQRCVLPDGQRIVTASADKTARVWNAASGQLVAKLEGAH